MKKILFDASVHLGQFNISDEQARIAAKNSQVSISLKPNDEIVGFCTFNENSFSDDIIWSLQREFQDAFYKFMDLFHSVKNIERVPLIMEDSKQAIILQKEFDMDFSNSLTCAVALRRGVLEIHTFYKSLLDNADLLKKRYKLIVGVPAAENESRFDAELEAYYQATLKLYNENKIDLFQKIHK